jgi:hypothetical protein
MKAFIRGILWFALVSTAMTFLLLLWLLPSVGFVAELISIVVVVGLFLAGTGLVTWADTDEAMEYHREKWAFKDRVEAEWALQDKICAVVPGGPLVLEARLKELAATRKGQS